MDTFVVTMSEVEPTGGDEPPTEHNRADRVSSELAETIRERFGARHVRARVFDDVSVEQVRVALMDNAPSMTREVQEALTNTKVATALRSVGLL